MTANLTIDIKEEQKRAQEDIKNQYLMPLVASLLFH